MVQVVNGVNDNIISYDWLHYNPVLDEGDLVGKDITFDVIIQLLNVKWETFSMHQWFYFITTWWGFHLRFGIRDWFRGSSWHWFRTDAGFFLLILSYYINYTNIELQYRTELLIKGKNSYLK